MRFRVAAVVSERKMQASRWWKRVAADGKAGESEMSSAQIDRRRIIAAGVALSVTPALITARPAPAAANGPSRLFADAHKALVGERPLNAGRVTIEMPRLAENGNSVPIKVMVESPMSAADHVRTIHLLSEQNPIATIGRFHLTPRSGRAEVETFVRLMTTQNVHAIAELSNGQLFGALAECVVLLAACLDGG
jgi:sulfur-oxidizing protein SoxY